MIPIRQHLRYWFAENVRLSTIEKMVLIEVVLPAIGLVAFGWAFVEFVNVLFAAR